MLAVCLLEQVKPSLIVAARRRVAALFEVIEVENPEWRDGEPSADPRFNHVGRYREIAARKSQLAPCLTSLFANYDPSAGSPPEK
jgi:hypothetical protein